MTVSITANFKKTTEESGFVTLVQILNANGIGLDVLVFDTETDDFSRVATVFDYETYPATKAAAAAMNLAYYRGRAVLRTDNNIVNAIDFERITQGRLKSLAVAWDKASGSFEGDSTLTFDSTAS